MPKFRVTHKLNTYVEIDIEAEDEETARQLAAELHDSDNGDLYLSWETDFSSSEFHSIRRISE